MISSTCIQPRVIHSNCWSKSSQRKTVVPLTRAIVNLDTATREHCERLAVQCRLFGEYLKLSSRDIYTLMWGGYLHDVGKVAIPSHVLLKSGQLTLEEWKIMKQHVLIGESICSSLPTMQHILPLIRHHHEHWNGSGYPDGLAGNEIPFLAQVIQILDIYDALTHARSYKPAFTSEKALEILTEETTKGWHHPELMQQFLTFKQTNR